MYKPESYNSQQMIELSEFAWDRSRCNADAERARIITTFFAWLCRRAPKAKPATGAINGLHDRAAA